MFRRIGCGYTGARKSTFKAAYKNYARIWATDDSVKAYGCTNKTQMLGLVR